MNHTIRNLLIATALMILGIVLTTSFINKERKSLSRGKQEITVFVAKKDIPPGTSASKLEEGGFLETKQIVREDAPPQPVSDLKDLSKLTSDETVYKGEFLTLGAFEEGAKLAAPNSIKGNQRLFSVPFNSGNAVGGLIRPGDRVDIVASAQLQAAGGSVFEHWVVARDILIVETPDSLQPASEEEPTEAKAPEADGDRLMYVLRGTDKEAAEILFANSASDDFKLFMLLRPASGDTETPIDPIVGPVATLPEAPEVKTEAPELAAGPSQTQR